jgi:hypothetical protein
MENLEDSSMLALNAASADQGTNTASNSGIDQAKAYYASAYPAYNYQQQQSSYMPSYPSTQAYAGLSGSGSNPYAASSYYQTASSSPNTSSPVQPQSSSSLLQSPSAPSPSAYSSYNYPATSSLSQYPQYQQPSQMSYASISPQATYSQHAQSPTLHTPAGTSSQNLLSQINQQGMVNAQALENVGTPNKRRREEKPRPQSVQSLPQHAEYASDNWDSSRAQYQPPIRKRSRRNYDDADLDDDDIEEDLDIDERELEELQNEAEVVERRSTRERRPPSRQREGSGSPPRRNRSKKQEEEEEEAEEAEEPEESPVEVDVQWPEGSMIETNEETKVNKYSKVSVNGNVYSVGDTIALWPETKKSKPPMGTIKSLFTEEDNNNVECCWFYRAEETSLKGKQKQKVPPQEVFLSEHSDVNPVESIWKKVTVKSKYEIPVLEDYLKGEDCYYYERSYNHLDLTFKDL